MLKFNNKGDTLVEVLMSIAVIATVLGGSFVTINRSHRLGKQAEERGVALRLAESQIEELKSLVTKSGGILDSNASLRTLFDSRPVQDKYCIKDSVITPSKCTDGIYSYFITKSTLANVYDVAVEWPSYGKGVTSRFDSTLTNIDTVELNYKIHKENY